jgi:cytidylate kinase
MKKETYVVTIQRQFGSMGRPIARSMSEKLGIEFYDRDLVDQAAQKLNLPVSRVRETEETGEKKGRNPFWQMLLPLGSESPDEQDKIFEAQKNIIQFLAEKESCIIVGRCSDFILHEMKNAMHIYIYAPFEVRVRNSVEQLGLSEDEARRMCVEVDKARDSYQMRYAGCLLDDKRTKNLLIDSSLFGVEGTAEFLVEAVKRRFRL